MLRMARHVHARRDRSNLCLAGGVALNCVGNGRILRGARLRTSGFSPPREMRAVRSGVALLVWHQSRQPGGERRGRQGRRHAGRLSRAGSSRDEEIETHADAQGAAIERLRSCAARPNGSAAGGRESRRLVPGPHGIRPAFARRAQHSRAIPRSPRMQSMMNLKIKFRESFRPFAPSVLRERVAEYFEMDCDSPYMLLVAPGADELSHRDDRGAGAAVRHREAQHSALDDSRRHARRLFGPHPDRRARINPTLPRAHRGIQRLTGCGVLVNTRFNVRGEPIVCTPEDA